MWCYYFDQRLPEHGYVLESMREVVKSEEIACNTVIAMEVAHYLIKHFPAGVARRKISYFVNLRNLKIANFDRRMMAKAIEDLIEYAHPYGIGGRDATIIATLKSLRVKKILTHDDALKRLAIKLGFEAIDPIPAK